MKNLPGFIVWTNGTYCHRGSGDLQELTERIKVLDARLGERGLFAFMWPVARIV
jgi:hypothetical protein